MASISVELSPFPVPTGVTMIQKPGLRQDGFRPAPQLKLSDLSPATLDAMCEEFRTAVFEAAGQNPAFARLDTSLYRDEVEPGSQEALNRR